MIVYNIKINDTLYNTFVPHTSKCYKCALYLDKEKYIATKCEITLD